MPDKSERGFISFVPEMWASEAATASTAPSLSTNVWAASRNFSRISGETACINLTQQKNQIIIMAKNNESITSGC